MLKSVVKKILKTADLEEVTMKTVCKQVMFTAIKPMLLYCTVHVSSSSRGLMGD